MRLLFRVRAIKKVATEYKCGKCLAADPFVIRLLKGKDMASSVQGPMKLGERIGVAG